MKSLYFLIIAIIVIGTIVITTVSFLTLQNTTEKQNQEEKIQARVHILLDNGTKYVKMNDLLPSSAMRFSYPYVGNATFDTDAAHAWELVRLPQDLNGNKNDISSFRAYSMVDMHTGCLVIYRPQSEKLVDNCHDDTFEPVNGLAIAGNVIFNKYSALPDLDLGVDDQGYIYVKQPIFEFNKNGVIGAGREIFHCTDPQQIDLQYDVNNLTTRQQIESIILADPKIQKIIGDNSCEFMADGILHNENGTYRTINIHLNNTEELSATVNLQNRTAIITHLAT